MCYDIKTNLEAQLSRANRKGDLQAIEEIKEKQTPLTDLPIHHTTGFNHPKLLIYTDRSPWVPEVSTWGLVPHWVKDKEQVNELLQTIAKSVTIKNIILSQIYPIFATK